WRANSTSGQGKHWTSNPQPSDLANVLRRPVEPTSLLQPLAASLCCQHDVSTITLGASEGASVPSAQW
ncbi:MAG: hypothetical protein ABMA14_19810, partial [Hyphomonadaceae bacterium]